MTEPHKVIPEEYRCKSWLCRAWNNPKNPFGNWNEPKPYPEKRKVQADASWIPNPIWWQILRNPVHNLTHYWLGITPVGKHGEWHTPEENGWTRVETDENNYYWQKGHIKLPIKKGELFGYEWYIGWMKRGNFGMAFRRK